LDRGPNWEVSIVSIESKLNQEIEFRFGQQLLGGASVEEMTQDSVPFERLFDCG
jgi:hypothetical protein